MELQFIARLSVGERAILPQAIDKIKNSNIRKN